MTCLVPHIGWFNKWLQTFIEWILIISPWSIKCFQTLFLLRVGSKLFCCIRFVKTQLKCIKEVLYQVKWEFQVFFSKISLGQRGQESLLDSELESHYQEIPKQFSLYIIIIIINIIVSNKVGMCAWCVLSVHMCWYSALLELRAQQSGIGVLPGLELRSSSLNR